MAYSYILFYVVKTGNLSETRHRVQRALPERISDISELEGIEQELLREEQENRRAKQPPGMEDSVPELSVELTGMYLIY